MAYMSVMDYWFYNSIPPEDLENDNYCFINADISTSSTSLANNEAFTSEDKIFNDNYHKLKEQLPKIHIMDNVLVYANIPLSVSSARNEPYTKLVKNLLYIFSLRGEKLDNNEEKFVSNNINNFSIYDLDIIMSLIVSESLLTQCQARICLLKNFLNENPFDEIREQLESYTSNNDRNNGDNNDDDSKDKDN